LQVAGGVNEELSGGYLLSCMEPLSLYVVDNGPEFIAYKIRDWLKSNGIKTHYITRLTMEAVLH